ncbi:MAG: phenylalanine--tRNA ligase subunit beta, partial [Oscillospiraceae bacterium]|nr:phenylalanine--tRNA ligase subunit beta [Oscillospiraceae bacterium]
MQLSRKWLNEFTDVSSVGDREFCERMTLSGSKVETYSSAYDTVKNVVVGRVDALRRHPDSDHLWICQVNVGDKLLQIVTGAQNLKEGDIVPVALDGSVLPGGKEIHSGALRGVESDGMLCSLGELGLTKHDFPYAIEDGIFILQEDCRPGDDIRDVCRLRDTVVEFELTFNRPDCLSYIGIAREAAATFGGKLKIPVHTIKEFKGKQAGE